MPNVNSSSMGGRKWQSARLVGPLLETIDNKTTGYKHHLMSIVKFTKTMVEVKDNKIRYVVIDLDTDEIITMFEQEYKDLRFYGPIVTPYKQGANISWRTQTPSKTFLCVNDVLYFGTNKSLETKFVKGCDFIPDIPELKDHSLFIPLSQFNATLFGKLIKFNNTPKEKVKFLITTDVHEQERYAHLGI
jgi:hypothetical protein